MSQLKNERSDARVSIVCGAILSHFGGFEGFCDAWGRYIDDAQRRGGIPLVRALEAVARLIMLNEKNFHQQLDKMTLSQLEAMLAAEQRGESVAFTSSS